MYLNARAIFRERSVIFVSKICYFTYQSYNWNTKYICAHLKGFILMSVKAKILLILLMMKVISSKLVRIVSNIKIIVFFILASWRKEYLQILCVVQGVPYFLITMTWFTTKLFKQCILILLSPRQGNKNVFISHLWKCNFILRPQFVLTFHYHVSIYMCVCVFVWGCVCYKRQLLFSSSEFSNILSFYIYDFIKNVFIKKQ
jgi:hypothetical protein